MPLVRHMLHVIIIIIIFFFSWPRPPSILCVFNPRHFFHFPSFIDTFNAFLSLSLSTLWLQDRCCLRERKMKGRTRFLSAWETHTEVLNEWKFFLFTFFFMSCCVFSFSWYFRVSSSFSFGEVIILFLPLAIVLFTGLSFLWRQRQKVLVASGWFPVTRSEIMTTITTRDDDDDDGHTLEFTLFFPLFLTGFHVTLQTQQWKWWQRLQKQGNKKLSDRKISFSCFR